MASRFPNMYLLSHIRRYAIGRDPTLSTMTE